MFTELPSVIVAQRSSASVRSHIYTMARCLAKKKNALHPVKPSGEVWPTKEGLHGAG